MKSHTNRPRMLSRPRRKRGFLLMVLLGLVAALAVLMLGWMWQGQSLSMLWRRATASSQRQQTIMDTTARMGIAINADPTQLPTPVLGNVSLQQNFVSAPAGSNTTATVRWGAGSPSMRYPVAGAFSSYANLFGAGQTTDAPGADHVPDGDKFGHIPRVGYEDELVQKNSAGLPLAPGHVLMTQEGLGGPDHVTVFDQSFPFGVYAPQGSVQLDSLMAWTNPTLEDSEKEPDKQKQAYAYASGLPVLVRARRSITVKEEFPAGKALSQEGPIQLPTGGALAFSGPQPEDVYCQNLTQQISQAMSNLSQDTLEKSKWIAGRGLSIEGVKAIFSGKSDSGFAFLSADQAMHFPFPPFPTVQEDILVTILMIHHPWPADFSGSSSDGSEVKELESINKQLDAYEKQIDSLRGQEKPFQDKIKQLQAQLSDPNTKPEDKPGIQDQIKAQQKQIDALEGQIQDLQDQEKGLRDRAKQIQDDIQKKKNEIFSNMPGRIPDNAWEDANQPAGSSWAYVIVGEALMKTLFDLLGGGGDPSKALNDLIPPVRLVHLGAMNPGWRFSDDSDWPYPGQSGYILKSTVNVPAGKTLKLAGPNQSSGQRIEIQGDLWIQRGATCTVDGDLFVTKPATWSDIAGVSNDPVNPSGDDLQPDDVNPNMDNPAQGSNPLYPWGRIILEEGASLVVNGNLEVSGGARDLGSVVVCSKIGANRAINTAILCKGNVSLKHGIFSGVSLEDLTGRLALEESPQLYGFYRDFLVPALYDIVPNVSKVIGPWDDRDPCYFAEHATTFIFMNFLAELGLAEVPFPIPLPVPNMERSIFKWMSRLYALELNFSLGENLYTQANWWLLGRGVAPIFLKVPPDLVKEAFADLDYKAISKDAAQELLHDFLTEIIPDIVKLVVNEFVVKVVEAIIQEVVPFSIPGEPEEEEEQKEEEQFEQKLKKELTEIIEGELKKNLIRCAKNIVINIKDKIFQEAGGEIDSAYLCREVPGVLVYAGGNMIVGESGNPEGAATALGFFYAEGNLDVAAQKIVGSLVSHTGSIGVSGDLLYYPYFTRASLYNPAKINDDMKNAFQFTVPDPGSNTSIDLGWRVGRVTATGEIR